jgi:hypothetical protein
MTFSFDLGRPFRPFEQLMGVLPEASKDLISQAYQARQLSGENALLSCLTHFHRRISCMIPTPRFSISTRRNLS